MDYQYYRLSRRWPWQRPWRKPKRNVYGQLSQWYALQADLRQQFFLHVHALNCAAVIRRTASLSNMANEFRCRQEAKLARALRRSTSAPEMSADGHAVVVWDQEEQADGPFLTPPWLDLQHRDLASLLGARILQRAARRRHKMILTHHYETVEPEGDPDSAQEEGADRLAAATSGTHEQRTKHHRSSTGPLMMQHPPTRPLSAGTGPQLSSTGRVTGRPSTSAGRATRPPIPCPGRATRPPIPCPGRATRPPIPCP